MNDRRSSVRAFAGRFVIALVVGSFLMAGAVKGVNREIGNKLDTIPKIDLKTAPLPPDGANYLIVGVDNLGEGVEANELECEAFGCRDGDKNSDTMMIVHVEPAAERTLIVSFPRDLWVNIPGHGGSKLNGAFQYGAQTIIDTFKSNFDVDINHYIELNFKSFVGLVNTLGNVSVYVPYEAQDIYTGLGLPNGGCWELDGEKSLQWVRSRFLQYRDTRTGNWVYADIIPDLGRIARQQDFMRRLAGIAVAKSLSNPFTANAVADEVVKNLKVDDAFDKSAIFDLIDAFRGIDVDDQSALDFQAMPSKPGPNQGVQQVLYADMNTATPLIQRLRAFDPRPRPTPAPATVRLRIVNASGREDLGIAAKRRFEELGFVVTEQVESAISPGSTMTYAPGQLDKAKFMTRFIEAPPYLDLDATALTNADVEIVIGRNFTSIVVPADALDSTTTTTPAPADPALDTPLELPPPPAEVVLPNPASRVGC